MSRFVFSLLICALLGCGNGAISPEDEFLSQVMALTNLGKTELRNADGLIVGVDVSVDVINTAPVSIEAPFVMTWRLRLANGDVLALANHRFGEDAFGVSERRRVHLVLAFPARVDLEGIQDAATFEFESTESSAAIAGAGVLTMSSGPPCNTWTYMRQGRLLKG
ncbi:MAG: hypothetical protein HOE48_17345 [Candidatus Latescibacteria bacterium]|jgi:hypothetical protein|nr:hypothetical protein [Candidatus Latescibacterota bacterium]